MTSTESREAEAGSTPAEHGVDPAIAETPDADASGLGSRLSAVEAGLSALVERLADESARAAARERVIDRQHAEIERLRAAERSGRLRPVVTDLYRLRNDLLRQADRTPDEITGERARTLLRSYADEVADALERCGVAALPDAAGEPFEPGRHQAAEVVATAEPERDGTVSEVLADGYWETDTGRVIAPARVTLYRCEGEAR